MCQWLVYKIGVLQYVQQSKQSFNFSPFRSPCSLYLLWKLDVLDQRDARIYKKNLSPETFEINHYRGSNQISKILSLLSVPKHGCFQNFKVSEDREHWLWKLDGDAWNMGINTSARWSFKETFRREMVYILECFVTYLTHLRFKISELG